jgi:hypothetical protein
VRMLFIKVPSGVLNDFLTRTDKSVSIENSPELLWPVAEVRGPGLRKRSRTENCRGEPVPSGQ